MKGTPGYWMYETSGALRPAVVAYLSRQVLSDAEIAAIRAYLRQWIMADVWARERTLEELRADIDNLGSRSAIERWLGRAEEIGIDPL
jgi:hypothetical protein